MSQRGEYRASHAPKRLGIRSRAFESIELLPRRVKEHTIKLGIIAVPAVADALVDRGASEILNFAPAPLNAPRELNVISVHLANQLEMLSYQIQAGQHASHDRRRAAKRHE